jgi:HlyD family secretion protein
MTRVSSSTHRDGEVNYDSALGTRVQRGPAYFEPRVVLSDEAQQHLGKLKPTPGMPAEVRIQTAERTALSDLIKPLRDQVARTFREQ